MDSPELEIPVLDKALQCWTQSSYFLFIAHKLKVIFFQSFSKRVKWEKNIIFSISVSYALNGSVLSSQGSLSHKKLKLTQLYSKTVGVVMIGQAVTSAIQAWWR